MFATFLKSLLFSRFALKNFAELFYHFKVFWLRARLEAILRANIVFNDKNVRLIKIGKGKSNDEEQVSFFVSTKTKQNIFDYTSVFVLFPSAQPNSFPFENTYFSMRFGLSSTLNRLKTLMEMWNFLSPPFSPIYTKNVFRKLHFWNRFRKPSFSSAFLIVLVWTIGETAPKSIIRNLSVF